MITVHLHWNLRRILIQHNQAYSFPLFHLVSSDSGPKNFGKYFICKDLPKRGLQFVSLTVDLLEIAYLKHMIHE